MGKKITVNKLAGLLKKNKSMMAGGIEVSKTIGQ